MDAALAFDSFRYDNTECWLEMILKTTSFPSTNNLYGINSKSKVVFTLPHVTQFKSELKDQIILTDPKSYCPWITNSQLYFLNFTFILNHGFWSRDLDNLLKATQDVLFECLGVNDSLIIEHHNYKNFKPGTYEYLILRTGLSLYPYNQFNTE